MKTTLSAIGAVLLLFLGSAFILGSASSAAAGNGVCTPSDPDLVIAGYSGDQLVNAATIMQAGQRQAVPREGIIIAVMTAIGESTLRNLDYDDDATNPDGSTADGGGLFQQQPSQGWGTWEQIMDPAYAASAFYGGPQGPNGGSPRGLLDVPGWETMEPSHAAHAVQINADKDHYTKFLPAAEAIVSALTCAAGGTGEWIVPAGGIVTGTFGDCRDSGCSRQHVGTDLADGTCQSPIWAASAGTATRGWTPLGGGVITIEHANGITTKYYHQRMQDILIHDGQQVATGDLIGATGNEGTSSAGCHLHFEVIQDGKHINPETFMASVGAPLPRR